MTIQIYCFTPQRVAQCWEGSSHQMVKRHKLASNEHAQKSKKSERVRIAFRSVEQILQLGVVETLVKRGRSHSERVYSLAGGNMLQKSTACSTTTRVSRNGRPPGLVAGSRMPILHCFEKHPNPNHAASGAESRRRGLRVRLPAGQRQRAQILNGHRKQGHQFLG